MSAKSKKYILTIILTLIGAEYGLISAIKNQNPYYYSIGSELIYPGTRGQAWHWQPSAVWLPSYILCTVPKNGFGITHTKSGYLFRSRSGRLIYFTASAFISAAFVLIPAIIIRKLNNRRQNRFKLKVSHKQGRFTQITN